jgi:hypothetical protein
MSTETVPAGTGGAYVPPKQSKRGQIFDSVFILALLFAVLFGVTYYSNAAAAPTTSETKPLTELPLTQAERTQYQRAIDEDLVDLRGVNDRSRRAPPNRGRSSTRSACSGCSRRSGSLPPTCCSCT